MSVALTCKEDVGGMEFINESLKDVFCVWRYKKFLAYNFVESNSCFHYGGKTFNGRESDTP